ncbi:MAG: hypothetical protein IT179_11520 [Acidobacteria bacterium]|nr:hypothetical protein [Acidobacteriota bacterium]
MPARSRRVVGSALGASALLLIAMAGAIYAGLLPFPDEMRGTVATIFGGVAVVDLLLGFWFFRSSLSS